MNLCINCNQPNPTLGFRFGLCWGCYRKPKIAAKYRGKNTPIPTAEPVAPIESPCPVGPDGPPGPTGETSLGLSTIASMLSGAPRELLSASDMKMPPYPHESFDVASGTPEFDDRVQWHHVQAIVLRMALLKEAGVKQLAAAMLDSQLFKELLKEHCSLLAARLNDVDIYRAPSLKECAI